MWPSPRTEPIRTLAFGGAAWLAAIAPAHAEDPQPVWFAVHASPVAPSQDTLLLRNDDGTLWAADDDLRNWGLSSPTGTMLMIDGQRWYSLDAQPGLSSRVAAADQALWLDVDPDLRTVQVRSLRSASLPASASDDEPGGWVDLDLQATHERLGTRFAGLVSANTFRAAGFGATTALLDQDRAVRLDTTWTRDDPEQVRRLAFGDSIADGGAFSPSLRFGGVSFGTEFSLQPDLVTFPIPQLRGVAALPSTLDVYVNGLLARHEQVDAGPFVLDDLPVQTGQGQARVVVRDLLGREQVLTQPFYASARLLRPDLDEWRFDAGWLRENYGFDSARYGAGFAAGTFRHGVTSRLTLEGRGEAGPSRQASGVGADVALPFDGVASLAVAASHAERGSGGRVAAGFDFESGDGPGRDGTFSFGARVRRVTPGWTDIGESRPQGRQDESAHAAMGLGAGYSMGLTWSHARSREQSGIQVLALNLSGRVSRRWFVTGSLARIDADGDASTFASAGLVGLWGGGTAMAESRSDAGRVTDRLEWQHNARDDLDDRYRVRADTGDDPRLLGESEWASTRGSAGILFDHDERGSLDRIDGRTRIAWLGSDAFWTRPGPEGFAVVDAHGLADVGVTQDHRLAGRTDARGLALLPGLRPYQSNALGLVDADIPIDAEVDALDKTIVPSRRGGQRVDFPVRDDSGRSARLVLPDGSPPPPGSIVRDPETGLRLPLGDDGTVWWSHGGMPAHLVIDAGGRACRADLPPSASRTAVITLVCAT